MLFPCTLFIFLGEKRFRDSLIKTLEDLHRLKFITESFNDVEVGNK